MADNQQYLKLSLQSQQLLDEWKGLDKQIEELEEDKKRLEKEREHLSRKIAMAKRNRNKTKEEFHRMDELRRNVLKKINDDAEAEKELKEEIQKEKMNKLQQDIISQHRRSFITRDLIDQENEEILREKRRKLQDEMFSKQKHDITDDDLLAADITETTITTAPQLHSTKENTVATSPPIENINQSTFNKDRNTKPDSTNLPPNQDELPITTTKTITTAPQPHSSNKTTVATPPPIDNTKRSTSNKNRNNNLDPTNLQPDDNELPMDIAETTISTTPHSSNKTTDATSPPIANTKQSTSNKDRNTKPDPTHLPPDHDEQDTADIHLTPHKTDTNKTQQQEDNNNPNNSEDEQTTDEENEKEETEIIT